MTKDGSADGAAGFAAWYGSNSRTLLDWGSVVGADITDSDSFYKYYGPDLTVTTRVGGALTSIYDPTKDNRALAFVSYSSSGTVQEIGLYDLGFYWADPADESNYPLGAYDLITLYGGQMNALGTGEFGTVDGSGNGVLTTSTVPEPSSASLMLLGAAGILALRRLRKNNV